MTKKYYFIILLFSVIASSQNLLVMRTVNENSNITNYYSQINSTNGSIINEYELNTNNSGTPNGPVYDSRNNTIYSFKGRKIFKHNISDFSDCISFGGAVDAMYEYHEIIHVNNRLFVNMIYNTHDFYYEISLFELDINDGSIIDTHTWTILYTTNGYGTGFSEATNELFIIVGNNLCKYNILTQQVAIFILPGTDLNTRYAGVVYANNRLFIRKQQVFNFQVHNYIHEVDVNTGAIIDTHELNSIPQYFSARSSLVYLAHTKEIACMHNGILSADNENIIVKYNIDTFAESSFYLPTEINSETLTESYSRIVSVDTEDRLGLNSFEQNLENLKIKAIYNLLGQQVPIETSNQVLIIEYENGERVKKINPKN